MTDPQITRLRLGSHPTREHGMCAMEAVAWLAGEPHSDEPACACPVVASYVRHLNDSAWPDDATRTAALVPHLRVVVGSRKGPAAEAARAAWLVRRVRTHWTPAACARFATAPQVPEDDPLRRAIVAMIASPTNAAAEAAHIAMSNVFSAGRHVLCPADYVAASMALDATRVADQIGGRSDHRNVAEQAVAAVRIAAALNPSDEGRGVPTLRRAAEDIAALLAAGEAA